MPLSAPLFDAERLTRVGRVTEVVPSHDGTWLAVAVSILDDDEGRYMSNLWRVSLSDPEAPPIQLTRGVYNNTSPRFRYDGTLTFLSDRPLNRGDGESRTGSGRQQVWMFPLRGGEPVPLTDEPLGVLDFRFARETGQLFLLTNVFLGIPHDQQRTHAEDLQKRGPSGVHFTEMPVRHWDYWIGSSAPHLITFDLYSEKRRDLTPNANREHRPFDFDTEWDVSPDGRLVAISCARPGANRFPDVGFRLIDVDTEQSVDLGVVDNVEHRTPVFSPDGEAIACVRCVHEPGKADRMCLWMFEELDGSMPGRPLVEDWDVWPELAEWSPDGEYLLVTAGIEGETPVFRLHVETEALTRLSSPAAGGCHASVHFSGDFTGEGEYVVGLRHRLRHPPEPFRMIVTENATPKQLANLSGFLPLHGEAVATWESFTVTAADGTEIQSFLVLPRGHKGPHPTLLWIHGGPMGQHRDGWHWRWNPLIPAAAGYAVILPNPRGSTGRGQAFIDGIWNNQWGGTCRSDILAVTDAVCARDDIDEHRIAAMGGSFGGYMANWLAVTTERFRCIMTHAGIFSLSRFSTTSDYPAYFYHQMGINPYEQPEAYDTFSPHRKLDQWKVPTLVLHGEKDYRVPIGEALHLFEALCWRGVDVELLVFPDENHWIRRPQNIRLWYRTVLEFASKHMSREP